MNWFVSISIQPTERYEHCGIQLNDILSDDAIQIIQKTICNQQIPKTISCHIHRQIRYIPCLHVKLDIFSELFYSFMDLCNPRTTININQISQTFGVCAPKLRKNFRQIDSRNILKLIKISSFPLANNCTINIDGST